METEAQELDPVVVAAIAAALAAALGTGPERLAIRRVEPVGAGSGGWPRLWALAGRQELMLQRAAMLRRSGP